MESKIVTRTHRRLSTTAWVALASGILGMAQPAGAQWLYSTLTSGKATDAGTFGNDYLAVSDDFAVVSDGGYGVFGFNLAPTSSGFSWTRDTFHASGMSIDARGVAITGNEVFVASGTYLCRFKRLSTMNIWICHEKWNIGYETRDVAADGNVVVVSYRHSNGNGGFSIYEKISGTWGHTYTRIGNTSAFAERIDVQDLWDVAFNRRPYTVYRNARMIISDRLSDIVPHYPDCGRAYVWEQSASVWSERAQLLPPSPASNGQFGVDVAIDGTYAFVGDPGSGSSDGQVVAFRRTSSAYGGWTHAATISPHYATANFGACVDADSGRIIVGQPASSGNGYAYVYERSGSAWNWVTTCASRDSAGDPSFGSAVAIDGDSLLVGGGDKAAGYGVTYFFQWR